MARKRFRIARPSGRAWIETLSGAAGATGSTVSPGLQVGRGLKLEETIEHVHVTQYRPAFRSGVD